MRQFVICSFVLLIGLAAIGRGQNLETRCPYMAKCQQAGKDCPADCQKAGTCCAEATATAAKTAACCSERSACPCKTAATAKANVGAKKTGCPCKAAAKLAKAAACRAKATACRKNASACGAGACQAAATACQTKTTACQNESLMCEALGIVCEIDSATCRQAQASCDACPVDEKIKHLKKATAHLRAAGMGPEAERVAALAEALRRNLLAQKVAELERLQKEIHQLKRAVGPPQHVRVDLKIAEVSLTNLRALGIAIPGAEASQGCPKNGEADAPCSNASPRITVRHCDREAIAAFIDAVRKQKSLKVVAAPKLVTVDGRAFSFAISGENPASRCCQSGTKNGECREPETRIDAVVNVLAKGKVRLKLHQRHRTRAGSPCTDKVKTQVYEIETDCEVKPGTTLVIGGPVEHRPVNVNCDGVMLTETNDVQRLLLVTPELIDALPPVEAPETVATPKPVDAPTAQAPSSTKKK